MTVSNKSPIAAEREERAADAMRENLRRRKVQQQARAQKNVTPSKED